jgi:putative ABC transport system substrate-binding protein
LPVIGFANGQSRSVFAHLLAAFHRGLKESGFVEGQNVAIEYRWAEGQADRMAALVDDLVRRKVAVIVATGGAHPAAKAATTTIPIVCTMGGDPVKDGYVASLNRPGGNLTGAAVLSGELEQKRLELLHQLVPRTAIIGVLVDPTFSAAPTQLRQVQAAARALGQQIKILNASTESEIEAAFAAIVAARAGAVAVTANRFFNSRRATVIALAARHAIPALYEYREAPLAGGLISYGPSIPEAYRQVGIYAGRILKGEKPGDLPVVLPSRFEMVINLKTAKALGLAVPLALQVAADEVIE